jgi:phosphoribosylformylglycinamidine synthase
MLIGLGGGAASSMATGTSSADLDFASVQRENPEMERRCQEVIDRCWQLGDNNPIASSTTWAPAVCPTPSRNWSTTAAAAAASNCATCPTTSRAWPARNLVQRIAGALRAGGRADDFERFQAICERERCPFAVVGEATEEPHLTVTDSHFGNSPVDMPLEVLLGKPPRMHRSVTREAELGDDFDPSGWTWPRRRARAASPGRGQQELPDHHRRPHHHRPDRPRPDGRPVAGAGGRRAVTATSFDVYTGEAMAMGERTRWRCWTPRRPAAWPSAKP